jgi:hypothetical protein
MDTKCNHVRQTLKPITKKSQGGGGERRKTLTSTIILQFKRLRTNKKSDVIKQITKN